MSALVQLTARWDDADQFMLGAALLSGASQRDLRDWFPERSPYAVGLAVQLHDRKMKRAAIAKAQTGGRSI